MKIEDTIVDEKLTNSTFVGYLATQNTPLVKLRLLLIRLLLRSQLYSPDILLNVLTKAGPLDIEKAIVFGRVIKRDKIAHMADN
jgi:hypothetical protein